MRKAVCDEFICCLMLYRVLFPALLLCASYRAPPVNVMNLCSSSLSEYSIFIKTSIGTQRRFPDYKETDCSKCWHIPSFFMKAKENCVWNSNILMAAFKI